MTDAVKGVSAQSVRYEDGQYRRSRLDRVKARALKNNKNSQNVFAKDKAAEYKRDIPELTQKQANSFGKKTMQNERAAANVDDTMVFIDQNKMNAAKNASKDSNIRYVYAEDENVRKIVAENPGHFVLADTQVLTTKATLMKLQLRHLITAFQKAQSERAWNTQVMNAKKI